MESILESDKPKSKKETQVAVWRTTIDGECIPICSLSDNYEEKKQKELKKGGFTKLDDFSGKFVKNKMMGEDQG